MQDLMDKEKTEWKKILHSVVEVIKFLCKQNFPLRGHREDSNSENQEKLFKTLKLLAKYNAVIKEHLSVIQLSSKGMTTYLSSTIQNELIEFFEKNGKTSHSGKNKGSKIIFPIYSIVTPNVSYIDQIAFIVRYIKVDSSEVQIKESFLNFFPLHRKNADEIIKFILNELQQNGLDIMMCRG